MSATTTIIDGHAHAASTHFIPRSFMQGVVDNVVAQLVARGMRSKPAAIMDMYLSKLQDHLCDDLIAEMDAAAFSETVLLLPDYTYALRDAELSIADMFERHRALLTRHPNRFRVFAGVDPRWGADGVELFRRGLRDFGFHGLKLYPPCGYSPADRELYPFYELCREYRVPVLTHIGATSPVLRFDTSTPLLLDGPARDFPEVDFILAHGAVHCTDDSIMMCSHRPNVFLDVSGFAVGGAACMSRVFSAGISHKIIFGTDWPVFRMQGSQRHILRSTFGDEHALPPDFATFRHAFFSGTITRLLGKRTPLAGEREPAARRSIAAGRA